ncbi:MULTISPECIES: hypothetical protein [Actinoplanes]|uniref:hypothetical protein n=1 Tax=Actinoplanes TaxID=1865 RepID=UPI0005F2F07A|nr:MULTISPECIES: hypothetical protein [Actinoplanes]GLY04512.1 hypothetical protein Acsp01_48910 [Actinoplanes sp. NBRC 101535]
MNWLRKSRPAFAVDGVELDRGSNGWYSFAGESLAARPAVTAAAGRLPDHPELADLPDYLSVATRDGREWSFGFDDGMLVVFDLSRPGSDTLEQVLAAQPWITAVERADREVFLLTVPEVLTADVVLARCVDACGEAFRRLHP